MIHITILLAILIFGILIFIHEFGHFITARLCKVTVREFAIGMGPKIFTKVSAKSGIRYSLRLLPIGGFVQMEGEDEDTDDENGFSKKPVWQRMIITAAGAFMNIVLGFVVMSILVTTQEALPSNTVAEFVFNDAGVCYSESSGLRVGDEIIEVDGVRVHIANETIYQIMRRGIEPVDVTVIRDGEKITIPNVHFAQETDEGVQFGVVDFKVYRENKTVGTVIKHSFYRATSTVVMIVESVFDLITGRYGFEAVSGVVGVTEQLGEAAKSGISDLVYLAVVISMNLGVMNLLPLPALDGGRLLFQVIELVRGKPLKPEIEGYIHGAGLILLMILMLVITVKDVINLF